MACLIPLFLPTSLLSLESFALNFKTSDLNFTFRNSMDAKKVSKVQCYELLWMQGFFCLIRAGFHWCYSTGPFMYSIWYLMVLGVQRCIMLLCNTEISPSLSLYSATRQVLSSESEYWDINGNSSTSIWKSQIHNPVNIGGKRHGNDVVTVISRACPPLCTNIESATWNSSKGC